MIRLALPKGRNLTSALDALRAAGYSLAGFETDRLRQTLDEDGVEVLLLKDWDLPLYVEYGIADCGVVGTDVLEELESDLLVPLRIKEGRCRMSLIGLEDKAPEPGTQARVASKYPNWAKRLLADRPWGAEIFRLQGSVELGPLLNLSEVAVDIVQTGRTLRTHNLCEIEILAEIAPCVVMNRASFQRHRQEMNSLCERLESAQVVS